MIRKTKIIATIGPATSSKEMLKALIQKGVTVCRLNFSHLPHEKAKEKFGHRVQIDDLLFISKNDAARYLNIKYGLSRNTALRRISRGVRNFSENAV